MGIDSGYPDTPIESFTIRLEPDTDVSVTPAPDNDHGDPSTSWTPPARGICPGGKSGPPELAYRLHHALSEAMPQDAKPGNHT